MFKAKTLFILGAGSNVCYGYSTGQQLIKDIIHSIDHCIIYLPPDASGSWYDTTTFDLQHCISLLVPMNCSDMFVDNPCNQMKKFWYQSKTALMPVKILKIRQMQLLKDNLITQNPISIDSFLRDNPSHAEAGRIMILFCLLKCDRNVNFNMRLGNDCPADLWYQLIVNDLLTGHHDNQTIANNDVNFLTFNYSCDLDYYLYHALNSIERIRDCEISNSFIETIIKDKIHHVYGKMHSFSEVQNEKLFSAVVKEVSDLDCFIKAIQIRKNIKLMYQERSREEKFRHLIQEAEIIKIIGFAFNEDNLRIIGLPDNSNDLARMFKGKRIQYMNYKGENKSTAKQLQQVNMRNIFDLTISESETISSCYQNEFKTPLFQNIPHTHSSVYLA